MSDVRGMIGIDLGCLGGLAVTTRSDWTCGGVLNSNSKSSDGTAAKNGAETTGVNKLSKILPPALFPLRGEGARC